MIAFSYKMEWNKDMVLPSVNVIYLRIYQKLILTSNHKQKNVLGREW
jgi:hypothetical protein